MISLLQFSRTNKMLLAPVAFSSVFSLAAFSENLGGQLSVGPRPILSPLVSRTLHRAGVQGRQSLTSVKLLAFGDPAGWRENLLRAHPTACTRSIETSTFQPSHSLVSPSHQQATLKQLNTLSCKGNMEEEAPVHKCKECGIKFGLDSDDPTVCENALDWDSKTFWEGPAMFCCVCSQQKQRKRGPCTQCKARLEALQERAGGSGA
mmetsp:Transcript_1189/g.2314  ORF Transcript_1189/g.2314 Transcript_1189/m.2314 type:complete len:206 (-) Transcript_1189:7-624(-)